MTLKSLALRTKKSLSGLYTLGKVEEQPDPLPETPKKYASSPSTEVVSSNGRSPKSGTSSQTLSPTSATSSGTDSPSRRVLRRSLRKMKSSFEVLRGKHPDEALSHVVRTPPSKPRPSLALNFEVSPPDQHLFNPERYSCNSSRPDIHHSSPITVPGMGKRNAPQSFPAGNTVPDSPAPLNQACVQDSMSFPMSLDSTCMSDMSPGTKAPLPTPMPGTNLTLEDIQGPPEIVVSSPSVPLLDADGYFAIPVPKRMDAGADGFFAAPAPKRSSAERSSMVSTQENQPVTIVKVSDPVVTSCTHLKTSDAVRIDSLMNTDSETSEDPYVLDDATRKSLERKTSCASAFLGYHPAADPSGSNPKKLVRRRSAWGRHTGLYDGTGYPQCTEDDRASQSTPVNVPLPDTPSDELAQLGEPGPAIDANAREFRARSTSGSGAAPSLENIDNKNETLSDILRAYSVYDDEELTNEQVKRRSCATSNKTLSANSTAMTLVG